LVPAWSVKPPVAGCQEHRHQRSCTVDHRGIDDLTFFQIAAFEQAARHTECEQHAPPPKSPTKLRAAPAFHRPTDRMQCAGQPCN
jgi:hypothetical protein